MQVTEAQVLAFRARRGHLAGVGASSPAEVARAVVGIQAQVIGEAYWAIAQRMAEPPTAKALASELLDNRSIVRTWAQRDTLHILAAHDWPFFAGANPLWPVSGRIGSQPPVESLDAARALMRQTEGPITRSDVIPFTTPTMIAEMAQRIGDDKAPRYAAGRIPWKLAHLGEVCIGPKIGREQGYVHRDTWLPDLDFPALDATEAALALVRRYLAVNAPASARDVAHFFGAKIGLARDWLAALRPELVAIECPEHPNIWALATDRDALAADDAPPPPRLLAGYDTLLMAFADKSWMVPVEAERKAVWRPSAVVSAVVLDKGRVVATYKRKTARGKVLEIHVSPLSGWRPTLLKALEPDAQALAVHLGLKAARLVVI